MKQTSLARVLLQPLAIAVCLAAGVKLVVQLYSIPSESMTPTLLPGDRVLVTRYLPGSSPAQGDVVVFRSPADGSLLVKRVVATAGEFVDSRGGHLRVGGYAVAEPYVSTPAATGSIQPQVIPQGRYFVLGDNREAAVDSRTWGPIPAELIVGRARIVVCRWHARDGKAGPALDRVFKWVR